ncbi:MAG: hypothetical protein KF897_06455 [Opitutaceae bacterium]|nr:hypothetical protein [Opitutaceae bacterium]
METHTNTPTQPPLRILAALLTAKEQLCARLADLGGQFETRLLRHQVTRAQASATTLANEAGIIVKGKTSVDEAIRNALADGRITLPEIQHIKRKLGHLGTVARRHHHNLNQFAS